MLFCVRPLFSKNIAYKNLLIYYIKLRYKFKKRLPGRKHVLEIQMQYNIHMQYNSVTFCMSNILCQDIKMPWQYIYPF